MLEQHVNDAQARYNRLLAELRDYPENAQDADYMQRISAAAEVLKRRKDALDEDRAKETDDIFGDGSNPIHSKKDKNKKDKNKKRKSNSDTEDQSKRKKRRTDVNEHSSDEESTTPKRSKSNKASTAEEDAVVQDSDPSDVEKDDDEEQEESATKQNTKIPKKRTKQAPKGVKTAVYNVLSQEEKDFWHRYAPLLCRKVDKFAEGVDCFTEEAIGNFKATQEKFFADFAKKEQYAAIADVVGGTAVKCMATLLAHRKHNAKKVKNGGKRLHAENPTPTRDDKGRFRSAPQEKEQD